MSFPNQFDRGPMYRNPEGTLPPPAARDIPVPYWQQTKVTFRWVESPLDPVMFSPAGRRFDFTWASPVFDLRPELRAAQGEARAGVPIADHSARLHVQVFGLNTADAVSGSAGERLSAALQDYGNAQTSTGVAVGGGAVATPALQTTLQVAFLLAPAAPATLLFLSDAGYNLGDTVTVAGGGNEETATITAFLGFNLVNVDFLGNNYPAVATTVTRAAVTGAASLVPVGAPSDVTGQFIQPGLQSSSAVAAIAPPGTASGGGDGYPFRFWQARVGFSKVILDADYPNGVPPVLSLSAVMY